MRATPNMWVSFDRAIARVSNVASAVFYFRRGIIKQHTFRSLSKMNS